MFLTQNDHHLMQLTLRVAEENGRPLGEWLELVRQGANLFALQDIVRPQRLSGEHERVIRITPFELMLCGWSLEHLNEALQQLPAQNWNPEWVLPNLQRFSQIPAMEMDQSDAVALRRFMTVAREVKAWRSHVEFVGPWEAIAARGDYLVDDLQMLPGFVDTLRRHGLSMTEGTIKQLSNKAGDFFLPRRLDPATATLLMLAGPSRWWQEERKSDLAHEERFSAVRALLDQHVFLEPATPSGPTFPKRRV